MEQSPKQPPAAPLRYAIEHDGFVGTVIGQYTRLDGKRGVVMQQDGTNIVHVYGEKWLKPAPPASAAERLAGLESESQEAAEIVGELRAKLAEAREALEPFAKAAERVHESTLDTRFVCEACALIRAADLRRARAVKGAGQS